MWIDNTWWILHSIALGRCLMEESLLELHLKVKELQVNKRCLKIKVLQNPPASIPISALHLCFCCIYKARSHYSSLSLLKLPALHSRHSCALCGATVCHLHLHSGLSPRGARAVRFRWVSLGPRRVPGP